MALAFQILFIAGIANLVFLVLILLSCRCISPWGFGSLLSRKGFVKFYNYHCYYWYGLFISVIVHTVLAFFLYGWPF